MNYVYLKDVQNMIKDGKNHKLCDKPNNPNYKYFKKDEINKKISETKIIFRDQDGEIKINYLDFLNNFIAKKYTNMVINQLKRFLEIIPLDLLNKIKFIGEFN